MFDFIFMIAERGSSKKKKLGIRTNSGKEQDTQRARKMVRKRTCAHLAQK